MTLHHPMHPESFPATTLPGDSISALPGVGVRPSETPLDALLALRQQAADSIEFLIAFLDATDGDADLEATADAEPSLAAPEALEPLFGYQWPAVGGIERKQHRRMRFQVYDQSQWGRGSNDDREDEHDGREEGYDAEQDINDQPQLDQSDDEPSLGSLCSTATGSQGGWANSGNSDGEACAEDEVGQETGGNAGTGRDEARAMLRERGLIRGGAGNVGMFKPLDRYFIDAGNGHMIEVVGVVA